MESRTETVQIVRPSITETVHARPLKFRPPGAPAGTWERTPWAHCVFYDPYERVNVWSHGLPGAIFALMGIVSLFNGAFPLSYFCFSAALTHTLSALTHVYPDDHSLEKLDHIGIVALQFGTALSVLWKSDAHVDYTYLWYVLGTVFMFAFLPPLARTLGFGLGGAALSLLYWDVVFSTKMGIQCALYVVGGIFFIRNGGHSRRTGFADHHILHYAVTIACSLQCYLLIYG
ncbi:hypothetical protein BSKO_09932 [Bryopsis sp. KO-2023]|nr:hypothetical protein BSKO_09932 [Bryopsis sp. KO-2023]